MSLQSCQRADRSNDCIFFTPIHQIIDRLFYIKKLTMMPFR